MKGKNCRICGEGNYHHGPKVQGCCGECVREALEVFENAIAAPADVLPFGLAVRVAGLQAKRRAS